jgi:thioredoxin-like negative regulator of GroEL
LFKRKPDETIVSQDKKGTPTVPPVQTTVPPAVYLPRDKDTKDKQGQRREEPLYIPLPAEETKPPANILELTAKDFDAKIKTGVALVVFYTKNAPSKKSLLEEIAAEAEKAVLVARVDVETEKKYIRQFNLKNVPTYIVFKNGDIAALFVGTRSKQVLLDAINAIK